MFGNEAESAESVIKPKAKEKKGGAGVQIGPGDVFLGDRRSGV